MERKYLLKLEGRSTRNSAVFTQSELDYLLSYLRVARTTSVQFYDARLDDKPIELLSELINVLTYYPPSI